MGGRGDPPLRFVIQLRLYIGYNVDIQECFSGWETHPLQIRRIPSIIHHFYKSVGFGDMV